MSLVNDCPLYDFASYLDKLLDEGEEVEDESVFEGNGRKRCKIFENRWECGKASPANLKKNTEVPLKIHRCETSVLLAGMCSLCGLRLEEESGVTFGYIHKALSIRNDALVKLRNEETKNLLCCRKLYLVLDLDHTLLNSTQLMHLTLEEDYLKNQTDSLQDVSKGSIFMLDCMCMMTKLRPYVRTFLEEANQMFEMYIYTMGDRPYALEMAKLLDPRGKYFANRVISRDDSTQRHEKGLDVVLGQENAVLILDDSESVWAKHKDSLILVERYHFFASSCRQFGHNCKSLSELKRDESESDAALASVLKVLKRIHQMFFDELGDDLGGRDVRQLLKLVRSEVLKGCRIVFTGVIPTNFQADNHPLWKMAEQLGATCVTEVDISVTHVVSKNVGTEKSHWAVKEKKFLVNPQWISAANFLWRKPPEENFPVRHMEDRG